MENDRSISLSNSSGHNISVLAVDDESHGLATLTNIIQSMPNVKQCATAKSVSEALNISYNHHIDILALDYHLGDGNGLDISEALDLFHKTIIVSADVAIKKIADKMGIPFLLKPIKSAELNQLINQLVSNDNKGAE